MSTPFAALRLPQLTSIEIPSSPQLGVPTEGHPYNDRQAGR